MGYIIRKAGKAEWPLLRKFLYNAVFIPEGMGPPPESIVDLPELRVYIQDFGKGKADTAFLAEEQAQTVGMVWARIMEDYGHLDNDTPSLAIAVLEGYRGRGIGTALMEKILDCLREKGYKGASLSVQEENPAAGLYKRLGFDVVFKRDGELVMKKEF